MIQQLNRLLICGISTRTLLHRRTLFFLLWSMPYAAFLRLIRSQPQVNDFATAEVLFSLPLSGSLPSARASGRSEAPQSDQKYTLRAGPQHMVAH
jgi:hypothetical protein